MSRFLEIPSDEEENDNFFSSLAYSALRPNAPEWQGEHSLEEFSPRQMTLRSDHSPLSAMTTPESSGPSTPLRLFSPSFLRNSPCKDLQYRVSNDDASRSPRSQYNHLSSSPKTPSESFHSQDARYTSPIHRSESSRDSPNSQLIMVHGVGLRLVNNSSFPVVKSTQHCINSRESSDDYIYTVQFKRSYRNFTLSKDAPLGIQSGDFVMVEADRGEDLGIVRGKVHMSVYKEEKHTAGHRGRGFAISVSLSEMKNILRIASLEEKSLIPGKRLEEEMTLQICRDRVLERGLPMTIVDAEYQLDRHKLTFYFESNRRVDFRDLVSDMFALYKTRIWMAQVDMASAAKDIGEEISMQAGLLPGSSDQLLNFANEQTLLPNPASRDRSLLDFGVKTKQNDEEELSFWSA